MKKAIRLLALLLLVCGQLSARQIRETPSKYPPLYVIDGVAFEGRQVTQKNATITAHAGHGVPTYHTYAVESIPVLKDQEAMKLYGPKDIHGALQIVMKK